MAYAPFNLTGKVALITGGNRGIGLGMADALAQAGADVVIWGSNAEANLAAEGRLNRHGVRVLAQRVDVSDEHANRLMKKLNGIRLKGHPLAVGRAA